jgi:alpha-beta hydrolase superfamily lysophospholipase
MQHTNIWSVQKPQAIVHIVHGISEHSGRYAHFAKALNEVNFTVYASDLRGHGQTAGSIENIGYFADNNGWELLVQDVIDLTLDIKSTHPNAPVFILGHSMGSFITRNVAFKEPQLADGFILSGTAGHPGWKGVIGKPISKLNGLLFGKKARSRFLMNTSFARFNKRIKNKRTELDWLTRDETIVDAYINDPFCSQIFTNQAFNDLAHGILKINKESNIKKINNETPVLFISGAMDPVGNYGKGPKEVFEKYKTAGATKIELKLFDGGRHEILNETNKEEVYAYIINWLREYISPKKKQ